MKRLFFVFISAFLLFSACTDVAETTESENAVNSASTDIAAVVNDDESDAVYLKVGFDSDSSSRTALPDVSVNNFSYISLMYINDGLDYASGYTMVGNWDSADELKNATLPFKVGTYYFTLTAVYNEVVLEETKLYTIQKGTNSLSFTPKLTSLSLEFRGKGNVNVALRFNTENVKKVKGGLYTTQGQKVSGYNDEILEAGSGGNVTYSKNDVPSGCYIVIFKFYADDNCEQLLGTYREYASIVNGLTSSSECVLDSIGSLFTINYELNGGAFADGVTRAGSYTKKMGTITLPAYTETTDEQGEVTSRSIYKTGYTFSGWYDNANFNGEPVTEIPSGSTGNKTFYAKWIENVTINYTTSAGSFLTTTHPSQTVVRGETVNLIYANTLGIKNGNKQFLGWTKETGSNEVEYKDGQEITPDANLTLYAVWGASEINPSGEADTTDTDGDGISDWQELNVYHTDPASKDTDGDGWTDGEELSLYNRYTNTFSPLIADTPSIEVKMTGQPAIKYNYSISESESNSESESFSQGSTGSSTLSSNKTNSFSETGGWSTTTSISLKFTRLAGPSELNIGHQETTNFSRTWGDSYTYGKSESEGWSKNWSNGKSKTKSNGKTVTDAVLSVKVAFKNPGNIAYTVEDLTLALYRISNNSLFKKIFVKNFSIDDKKVFTLSPGSESGTFSLTAKLTLKEAEDLLKYSNGFIVEVSGYKITLQRGGEFANDFTEALTQVKAKNASVYIDFGAESTRATRIYNTSVKYKYNANATDVQELYSSVSLKDIMTDILHLKKDVDYTLNSKNAIESIYEVQNKGSYKTGGWYISHRYYNAAGERMLKVYAPYANNATDEFDPDISKIIINAGDEISLVYTVDADGDGVPLHEELIYGTSDEKEDTDGDGLKDGEEIYGWYKEYLDSKYSNTDTGKVCTNPVLTDTDADDLADYSEHVDYRDEDPLEPQKSKVADLAVFKYGTLKDGTFKDVADISETDSDNFKLLYTDSDSIYLQVLPVKSLATLTCKTTYNGHDSDYFTFDETSAIPLCIGENTITVKCTPPSETAEDAKEFSFKVVSKFPEFKNFNAESEELKGGVVTLSWNKYVDNRADSKKYGGYYLCAYKESSFLYYRETLKYSTITTSANGTTTSSSSDLKGPSFALSIDPSNLTAGRYSLSGLSPNTNYCFYLFAYTRSDDETYFASSLLGKTMVKTAVEPKGNLTFYAHYVNDIKDQDGGCNPQYYWSFEDSTLGLSALDLTTSNLKSFDDDDDKYYGFSNSTMYKYGHAPARFSTATKEIKKEFERDKDYEFTVVWKVSEYDKSSYDDYLGSYKAVFKYSSSSDDIWTCEYAPLVYWTLRDAGLNYSSAFSTSTIKSGERTNGLSWELHNEDVGEVELVWDWGWE